MIVDANKKIVECNAAFVRLFAPITPGVETSPRQLEGAELASFVPFHRLFAGVLRSGEDLMDRDLRFRETILHVSIFSVEKYALVGAIIQDITKPAVQKEQVIRKARDVIQRNLSTVQQIAFLLGENAAESEITLNSIIESFSLGGIDDGGRRHGEQQADRYPRRAHHPTKQNSCPTVTRVTRILPTTSTGQAPGLVAATSDLAPTSRTTAGTGEERYRR